MNLLHDSLLFFSFRLYFYLFAAHHMFYMCISFHLSFHILHVLYTMSMHSPHVYSFASI